MNGFAGMPSGLHVPLGNPEVIGFLERMLVEAKAGKLVAVGVVMVEGGGRANAGCAGGHLFEVNFGADMLKALVLGAAAGQRSKIVRAG